MTKRELIDQILTENPTAEPAFLAQFTDKQLRDYLAHLKQVKQPRLSGNPSRFDRYFRNDPPVPTPTSPSRWRREDDGVNPLPSEMSDLSVHSSPPADLKPHPHPSPQSPPLATLPKDALPTLPHAAWDVSLPQEQDTLEAMQLSPQERTGLKMELGMGMETVPGKTPADDPSDPDDPPPGRNALPHQSPFANTDTDQETWMF
jgi:hypothetical protein